MTRAELVEQIQQALDEYIDARMKSNTCRQRLHELLKQFEAYWRRTA